MRGFRAWLIRWLGGERKVFVETQVVTYHGLGRPFDLSDWEQLATMQHREDAFFRFLAFQLRDLDSEEQRLKYGPDQDRERLAIAIRRAALLDLEKLPEMAGKRVAALLNQAQEIKRSEKGLSNHGR